MARLLGLVDRLLLAVAAVAALLMMSIATVSSLGRYLLDAPIPDDLVMNENLMVFVVFLPLGYVQWQKGHVQVTLFTDWLPVQAREAIELFALALTLAVVVLLAAASFSDFLTAWRVGAYSDGLLKLPEWPGRAVVAAGLAVFALRVLMDLAVAVRQGGRAPTRQA